MLAIAILLLGMYLAPGIKQITETARSPANLDCNNSSISIANKATCIAVDVNIFYFVGVVIFMAGAVLGAKVVFGGGSNG